MILDAVQPSRGVRDTLVLLIPRGGHRQADLAPLGVFDGRGGEFLHEHWAARQACHGHARRSSRCFVQPDLRTLSTQLRHFARIEVARA